MVRFNMTGLYMFLAGAAVMATAVAFGLDFTAAGTVMCIAWIVGDGIYRLRQDATGREKWLVGQSGGLVAFMPVWLLGLLMMLLLQSGYLEMVD